MLDDKLENKKDTSEDAAKKENMTFWREVVKAVDTKFFEVQDNGPRLMQRLKKPRSKWKIR
jgi:hypothetical protein